MSESTDWKDVRLVAAPDEPFKVWLSRMGSGDMMNLMCVGGALGFDGSGGEAWNDDGSLAVTGEQFRAGLLGILVLDSGTGHAHFEICMTRAAVKDLRALLARLEEAMDENASALSRDVDEGNVERADRPEFLPDDVHPGRTH